MILNVNIVNYWCLFGKHNSRTPLQHISEIVFFYCTFVNMSSSGGKSGEEWKSKIYFDPEADSSTGKEYAITDEELKTKMKKLINNENILKVFVYKVSLSEWQLTRWLFYHAFVVFETDKWWWSIEKNSEGITIQRSKKEDFVKDRYRRKKRPSSCTLMQEDECEYDLMELVGWLYQSDQLNKKYNVTTSNCKHFAKELFDKISKRKLVVLP